METIFKKMAATLRNQKENKMETIFKKMATALRNQDEPLFQSQWRSDGYNNNLVGSSGLSGQQLFVQGSRKGWYLKPRLAEAVDHAGAAIIPCDVWSDEQKRAVDEVYAAVVVENKQWLLLGAGEELAQVEAMVAHYLNQ